MIARLVKDAVQMSYAATGKVDVPSVTATVFLSDSYAVVALTRVRELARKLGLRGVNRLLRIAQTAVYGVEIGTGVTLGDGVYFTHTLGIVIGGNATIGARVKFMGNNTVGTAKDNGYPIVEDDVVIGCGARILGPVRVGARSVIGANAVVLDDVPPDSIAVGVPAKARTKRGPIDDGA